MYKRRLTKWKFRKNNTDELAQAVIRKRDERLAEGKETIFFYNHEEVDMYDLNRYIKRKGTNLVNVNSHLSSRLPMPDGLRCHTPVESQIATDSMDNVLFPPSTGLEEPSHHTRLALQALCANQISFWTYGESCLSVLRDYISGAFEAGIWLCKHGENYCRSSKATGLETDARGWISGQIEDACKLFDLGEFRDAGLRLMYVCATAREFVLLEAFNLMPELAISALEKVKGYPLMIKMVLQQFKEMSLVYHGAQHPLTRTLSYVLTLVHVGNDESLYMLRTAICVMADCVSGLLGSLHMQSVALQIDSFECGAGSATSLQSLLDISDQRNGRSSHTSIDCLRAMAYCRLTHHEDIESTNFIANMMIERATNAIKPEVRESGLLTALSIQIDISLHMHQYEQAARFIRQLLVASTNLSTHDSLHQIILLSRLEECLMHLGQHEEASLTKSHRMTLLPKPNDVMVSCYTEGTLNVPQGNWPS